VFQALEAERETQLLLPVISFALVWPKNILR